MKRHGLINEDPSDNIAIHRPPYVPPKQYSEEDFHTILSAVNNSSMRNAFLLISLLGIYSSELCALTKDCITIDKKHILIKNKMVISGKPRNYSVVPLDDLQKVRSIPLTSFATECLDNEASCQKTNHEKYGLKEEYSKFIFTTKRGRPISVNDIAAEQRKISKATGIEFSYLLLRNHIAIMLMLKGKNVKDIQDFYNFTSPVIPYRIWTEVDKLKRRQ